MFVFLVQTVHLFNELLAGFDLARICEISGKKLRDNSKSVTKMFLTSWSPGVTDNKLQPINQNNTNNNNTTRLPRSFLCACWSLPLFFFFFQLQASSTRHHHGYLLLCQHNSQCSRNADTRRKKQRSAREHH